MFILHTSHFFFSLFLDNHLSFIRSRSSASFTSAYSGTLLFPCSQLKPGLQAAWNAWSIYKSSRAPRPKASRPPRPETELGRSDPKLFAIFACTERKEHGCTREVRVKSCAMKYCASCIFIVLVRSLIHQSDTISS